MRRVDRGGIKLVFIRSLYASIFTVAEIYERKFSKFSKRIEIFDFFGPPCRNPLHDFIWFHAKMCGLCPTYVTGLDDAQENKR